MNMVLLSWDKFMPEMHLTKPEFKYSVVDHLLKIEKEQKRLKKKEIEGIFIKTN